MKKRLAIVALAGTLLAGVIASSASAAAPVNTSPPTITGTLQQGKTLTAGNGIWTNSPTSFTYQWQRCTAAGLNCVDIDGADGKTYGVRTVDVGSTLRAKVKATNLAGSQEETSDRSDVVKSATAPPPSTSARNHRPTIRIFSARFVGARLYVRFRVCDDSRKNLNITERDSKTGVPSYTRRFATLVPP